MNDFGLSTNSFEQVKHFFLPPLQAWFYMRHQKSSKYKSRALTKKRGRVWWPLIHTESERAWENESTGPCKKVALNARRAAKNVQEEENGKRERIKEGEKGRACSL